MTFLSVKYRNTVKLKGHIISHSIRRIIISFQRSRFALERVLLPKESDLSGHE